MSIYFNLVHIHIYITNFSMKQLTNQHRFNLNISALFFLCLLSATHQALAQPLDLSIQNLPEQIAATQTISLQSIIRMAVAKHPLVQQAKGEADASIAEIGIGVAAGKPKVAIALDANTFQGTYNRSQIAPNTVPLGPSITMRYPLWDRSRIDADVALRTSRADAINDQVNVIKLSLAQQIGEVYNEIMRQKSLIEVSHDYINNLEALTKDLNTVAKHDKGKRADAVLGAARVVTAQATSSGRVVALQESMNNLRQIITHELRRQSMTINISDLIPLDFEGVFPPTKDLVNQALDAHPRLIRARADIDTAIKQSVVAEVSNKPTTNLETSLSTTRNFDGHVEILQQFQLRIVRSWDAYDGGAAAASKKAADARVEVAMSNYENTKEDLETTLDTLWGSLTERQERIDVLFSGTSLAKEVRDTAKIQFTAGRRSLLDLLNFESDVFNAEQNLALENADLSLIKIKLLAQSGKLLAWANQ